MEDQVARRSRFEAAHPEWRIISPMDIRSALRGERDWRALSGDQLERGYDLSDLLDRLEELTQPMEGTVNMDGTMSERDGQVLMRLDDLWDPWYVITRTSGTIMPWHAKRRDDGSLFHARDARDLHNAISDNYLDGKPPLLALIPPAN